MPHESPWPVLLAVAVSLVFVMLLVHQYAAAGVMAVLCALALLGWHSDEPGTPLAAAARRRQAGGVVGDARADRERGDALHRVHRHVLLPPLQDHALAAGRDPGAEGASCR